MFYRIIMTSSAVTRAGAHCWHYHYLKSKGVRGHFQCFNNLSKKGHLKRWDNRQMFSGVLSCTRTLKVEQQLITWKWLFEVRQDTSKQPFAGLTLCFSVGREHHQACSEILVCYTTFFWQMVEALKMPFHLHCFQLVSIELQLSWLQHPSFKTL